MTDDDTERAERLADVDAWLTDLEPGCDGWYIPTRLVRWLRDEVERYREIAQAVVDGETVMRHAVFPVYGDLEDTAAEPIGYTWYCASCGSAFSSDEDTPANRREAVHRIRHTAYCIVTKSRTLLAD